MPSASRSRMLPKMPWEPDSRKVMRAAGVTSCGASVAIISSTRFCPASRFSIRLRPLMLGVCFTKPPRMWHRFCCATCHDVSNNRRKREVKSRPLAGFPFGTHPAAVAPDDPFHRGQADTESPAFLAAGEALERGKDLCRVRIVKTASVVPDEIHLSPVDLLGAELDDRILALGGVLPGVAEEVIQDHSQQVAISVCVQSLGDPDNNLLVRCRHVQHPDHIMRHFAEIDPVPVQFGMRQSGKFE